MDDFSYYQQNNPYQQPVQDKRSASMTTAATILGVISVTTCTCLYVSVACGGLAILLALLSKGGELTMSKSARLALYLGVAGLVITAITYAVTLYAIIGEYGSLEEYLRIYLQDYGMSLDDLGQLMP
ncbi:MAG: hypothetical protein MR016_00205 [Agathobacter sp.]|nr:hypothetical protein [Agathobacter sp.]